MKQIRLKDKVKAHPLSFVILLLIVAVLLVATGGVFLAVIAAPFFFWYFCCGKLKIKDGDIVLFWGLPGSGKSMNLVKVAYDNSDRHMIANEEFRHCKLCKTWIKRSDMENYTFGKHSTILYDEGSLNGFDNRNWEKNFSPEMLEFFKKIRHESSSIVFSNQGFQELDCKIRDSLVSKNYYVTNHGFYSKAVRLYKDITTNNMTGTVQEGYRTPNLIDRLLDRSAVLYVRHKFYGQFYSTIQPLGRPIFPFLNNNITNYVARKKAEKLDLSNILKFGKSFDFSSVKQSVIWVKCDDVLERYKKVKKNAKVIEPLEIVYEEK